jgi:hypothetical protein
LLQRTRRLLKSPLHGIHLSRRRQVQPLRVGGGEKFIKRSYSRRRRSFIFSPAYRFALRYQAVAKSRNASKKIDHNSLNRLTISPARCALQACGRSHPATHGARTGKRYEHAQREVRRSRDQTIAADLLADGDRAQPSEFPNQSRLYAYRPAVFAFATSRSR